MNSFQFGNYNMSDELLSVTPRHSTQFRHGIPELSQDEIGRNLTEFLGIPNNSVQLRNYNILDELRSVTCRHSTQFWHRIPELSQDGIGRNSTESHQIPGISSASGTLMMLFFSSVSLTLTPHPQTNS